MSLLAWLSLSVVLPPFLGSKQDSRCDEVNLLKAIICLHFPILELKGADKKALTSLGKY